jgi:hypothetical protein
MQIFCTNLITDIPPKNKLKLLLYGFFLGSLAFIVNISLISFFQDIDDKQKYMYIVPIVMNFCYLLPLQLQYQFAAKYKKRIQDLEQKIEELEGK